MKKLSKYSFGLGDRFAQQGEAQLQAILKAKEAGVEITPIWNKSNREHETLNSSPHELRAEANAAVQSLGWKGDYLVDADHIDLENVDRFIEASDFFTIDVADFIGQPAAEEDIHRFIRENKESLGTFNIPGIEKPFSLDESLLQKTAQTFLLACQEAARIYRHIETKKGAGNFITEVSMDEVEEPQSPVELYFILQMLAQLGIPAQTIALKFTGNFYKGVDYEGNIMQFSKEFAEDLLVIRYAVEKFGLPDNLKLSIHSGSDKFSLYGPIRKILREQDAGIHIKTAGTTWLEELIGLAEAGGEGLDMAKEIYAEALSRYEELTSPYSPVLNIDKHKLPDPEKVKDWNEQKFADSLRHNPRQADYNPHFRQLLHCAYKIAGEKGAAYIEALQKHRSVVGKNVTENLWERHIKPLFIASKPEEKL